MINAVPWLLFSLFGAGLIAWSLATRKAWHWGAMVTRDQNPGAYFQFLLGAALPMLLSLFIAYEALWW